MKYFKNIRFHIIPLIVIVLSIIFAYSGLSNAFFQQDEWQTFASDIYFTSKGIEGVIESFLPTDPLSHFAPFAAVFSWFEYIFYKTNFTLYAWQSIFLHILNAGLLYYFVFSWFKSKKFAIISALVFGVNSIPAQAVTWIAAANSYLVPTSFILLSLIFFQRRNILLSFGMLFISLMFHENGIFLLLLYPIIFFLYVKQKWRKKLLPIFLSAMIITIVIIILIRIPFFFGFSSSISSVTDIAHPSITVYPYRLISLNMKSFAGSLFPEKTLIAISDEVVRLAYPQFITSDGNPNPFIAQSIVFDLVSYLLSIFIVCIIVLLIKIVSDKEISKALIWSLIFVPLSVLPYAFVLGKAGYASIFEPKFLYITSIGTSILLATIVYWLIFKSSKSKILTPLILFCFVLYVLFHAYNIKSNVKELEKIGIQRKAFLTTITSSYPDLPKKVIFFTQSDTAHYGMPDSEKILPVQVGFGKMLMIWYQEIEKFQGCLYEDNFLMALLDQGYKECDNQGFGYFRQYDKLEEAIKSNSLALDSVIAYSWINDTKEFIDISLHIRKKLEKSVKSNL